MLFASVPIWDMMSARIRAITDPEIYRTPCQLPERGATWLAVLSKAGWRSSHELVSDVPNTRGLGKGRFVFNICGNHVRAILTVNFSVQVADVRFIGTHVEYDRIDARII